jgi:hypothetical protein
MQDSREKKNFIEKLSNYVPLFISVLALATAIWSAMQTRMHNQLSVRPDVRFLLELARGADDVGLGIENNGLGPAILGEMRIYLDGRKLGTFDEISTIMPTIWKEKTPFWRVVRYGITIKPGNSIKIYWTKPDNIQDWDAFDALISNRLFVIARSCSMYDECEDICSTVSNDDCRAEEAKQSRN